MIIFLWIILPTFSGYAASYGAVRWLKPNTPAKAFTVAFTASFSAYLLTRLLVLSRVRKLLGE